MQKFIHFIRKVRTKLFKMFTENLGKQHVGVDL